MWLALGQTLSQPPAIFRVIGFVAADGRFLWPGFGDNSRVLAWVFDRVDGALNYVETPIGKLPLDDAIDVAGLELPAADMAELLKVDVEGWRKELPDIEDFYDRFGDRVPAALRTELSQLDNRLAGS